MIFNILRDFNFPSKNIEIRINSSIILDVIYDHFLKKKYSSEELTQEQLKKIYDLKVITENIISKTVKVRNKKNIVKALVSKKKKRFCYDGFDLDLTYITSRIIAMGMPSSNLEGLYRNSMEEVQKFLNTRHPLHYKVYNLCEERDYPKNSFYKQGIFPLHPFLRLPC